MDGSPNIARIGALVGDPARAGMLSVLLGGRALSAGELAREVGVTAPTASAHLARLENGGLLRMRKQGRHRYYALAGDEVAHLLETMMGLVSAGDAMRSRIGPRDAALRRARVCYNHLAGDAGVRVFDAMIGAGHVHRHGEALALSDAGAAFVAGLGVDVDALEAARSPTCLECLDWSERRSHLAGGLGRALLARFESLRWIRRHDGSRALRITPSGVRALDRHFPECVVGASPDPVR